MWNSGDILRTARKVTHHGSKSNGDGNEESKGKGGKRDGDGDEEGNGKGGKGDGEGN